ncbi:MAG: mutY, partial [Ferruginibacter sp.]|nr:mutY [Ferruginibacter sp.]
QLSAVISQKMGNVPFQVESVSQVYKQLLTHQTIIGKFIHLQISAPLPLKGYKATSKKALQKLPFPKFISNYLKDKNVSLNLF